MLKIDEFLFKECTLRHSPIVVLPVEFAVLHDLVSWTSLHSTEKTLIQSVSPIFSVDNLANDRFILGVGQVIPESLYWFDFGLQWDWRLQMPNLMSISLAQSFQDTRKEPVEALFLDCLLELCGCCQQSLWFQFCDNWPSSCWRLLNLQTDNLSKKCRLYPG